MSSKMASSVPPEENPSKGRRGVGYYSSVGSKSSIKK